MSGRRTPALAREPEPAEAFDASASPSSFWVTRLAQTRLDERAPTPLYHQLFLVLRDIIREGAFGTDTLLPGEQTLAGLLTVSRITVKRALNELAAETLVSRHRGLGTRVTPRARLPVVRSAFDNLLESLQQMGLATTIELIEIADVRAGPAGVAAHLDLPDTASVQRAVRRRRLEGEPLSYLVTYTPRAIATRYSPEDVANTSFLELLERAGAAPLEAEQWITAVAAEPRVAAALDVDPAAPLLKIERIMRDATGAPVQLVHGYYRPDRFQYHVRNVAPPAPAQRPGRGERRRS